MASSKYNICKIGKPYLEGLRRFFLYDEKGVPDIYEYGMFKSGVTREEIKDYLMVRANSTNIKSIEKKFDEAFGCHTCSMVIVRGIQVTLYYRSDVKNSADRVFENEK